MLCSEQEQCSLRNAVMTTLAQVCKGRVTYQSELQIEGTVVITVDQQKVVVVHFSDHLPQQLTTQLCQTGNDVVMPTSSQDGILSDGCRLITSENLNLSTSAPSEIAPAGSCQSAKSVWCEASSSSKMMNSIVELGDTWNERVAIDLDAEPDGDSQSFSTPHFEDNSCGFSQGNSMEDVALPRECEMALSKRKGRRVKDAKNVIVIEDNELFNSDETLADTVEYDKNRDQKMIAEFAGRSSASSVGDCESIGDMVDWGSLTNELGAEVDPVISGFRSAVLACEVCGWHARTVSHLESHLVSQHDVFESERLGHTIKSVSCPVCNKRFRFSAQLSKHMSVHNKTAVERPYKCRHCHNTYCNPQSLALHSRVHDKSATIKGSGFNCNLCYKTYPNKILFQKHIIYMHERHERVNRKQ